MCASVTPSEQHRSAFELCRQAYIFLVILKHERRRRRDSDHYFLSLATQETVDYVYTSWNAITSTQCQRVGRETPPSAQKFSNTVNVVECHFLEPILHLSARGCSRGWLRGHIRWVTWARGLSAIFSRDCLRSRSPSNEYRWVVPAYRYRTFTLRPYLWIHVHARCTHPLCVNIIRDIQIPRGKWENQLVNLIILCIARCISRTLEYVS